MTHELRGPSARPALALVHYSQAAAQMVARRDRVTAWSWWTRD